MIITGAGAHFCSGADLDRLGEVEPTPIARKRMLTDHVHRVVGGIAGLDRPVIAALHGNAVGAGLDLALMCDIDAVDVTEETDMAMPQAGVQRAVQGPLGPGGPGGPGGARGADSVGGAGGAR